jgi:hypothetical protein
MALETPDDFPAEARRQIDTYERLLAHYGTFAEVVGATSPRWATTLRRNSGLVSTSSSTASTRSAKGEHAFQPIVTQRHELRPPANKGRVHYDLRHHR